MTLGRSGASYAGAISRRAPRSRVVANTAARWVPKRSKAPRSFGNRRPSRGGGGRGPRPCPRREGESPAPPKQRCGDPGARGNVRGGELARQTANPSLVHPRLVLAAEAKASGARTARFHRDCQARAKARAGPPAKAEKLGEQRGFGASARAEAKKRPRPPAIHGRGSNARRVCPRVVSCCRSRQAAPGPKKREQGPLLTERPIHVDGV